jgi:hypothetical protein
MSRHQPLSYLLTHPLLLPSAVKTCAQQSPGPAACLVETEETPEEVGRNSGGPETTADGDIL